MLRNLLAVAGVAGLACIAQPKFPQFPQHSTGMPAVLPPPAVARTPVVLPPPIVNHVTNLSGSIAGRPMPQRHGARPIYPAPYPVYIGSGWYEPPVQQAPLVLVNQQNLAPAPQPILVVNPDYKPETPKPVMREYSNISNPYENFQPGKPKVFLLALKDGTLRQSVAFWVEKEKLHFVQPDHKQDSITLTNLDRESTKRFNSERGLEIQIPE